MMLGKLAAFAKKDLLDATSYKIAFGYQVATLASSILTVYFLSRMVAGGNVAALDPYGGDYFSFAIIGVAFADYLSVSVAGFSRGIRLAQQVGTLEAMLATPTPPSVIVIGSALYRFLWSVVRVGIYVLAGLALGARFPAVDVAAVSATMLLSVLSFGAVGMLGAAFILVLKQWEPITALFSGLSWLLGGVLYPFASLPTVAQWAAWLLPITHALEAMRGALLMGKGVADLAEPLGVLALFTVAVIPLSLWSFRVALRHMRVGGSVAHY